MELKTINDDEIFTVSGILFREGVPPRPQFTGASVNCHLCQIDESNRGNNSKE